MKTPSWLGIVPLFIVVWLMAMLASGSPGAVVYATEGQRSWDDGHTVMLNEQEDDDDDDDDDDADDDDDTDEDNDEGDTDEDNDEDDGDDNDNVNDVTVVPVPVPVSAPAPPAGPSVSSVDEVSQCLASGGMLVYRGPDAGIAVTSFQDNLNVTLTRVAPTSQPAPPGTLIGGYVFRLGAAPCGGAPYSVLPLEVNLAITYSDTLLVGRDETRFALMFYDGMTWTAAPKLYRDPDHNHVSASVTGLGVYALVQQ